MRLEYLIPARGLHRSGPTTGFALMALQERKTNLDQTTRARAAKRAKTLD